MATLGEGTSERLCVALDSPDPERCLALASAVAPHASALKVGLTAFAAGGPSLVTRIGRLRPVFLDLKLHDIPAQIAGAVRAGRSLGVSLMTVHASGGAEMIRTAVTAAGDEVRVLAVTVLTSLGDQDLADTGVIGDMPSQVSRLASLAVHAGAHGLVCSPLEVETVRRRFGARDQGGPLLVVPGVRDAQGKDDQQRVGPGGRAVALGADLVVVGRPITSQGDPRAAAERVARELAEAASIATRS